VRASAQSAPQSGARRERVLAQVFGNEGPSRYARADLHLLNLSQPRMDTLVQMGLRDPGGSSRSRESMALLPPVGDRPKGLFQSKLH